MRILYGVVGEGMGHATRSRVVLEHLLAAGHEVCVVVSGRAHRFLVERFSGRANIRLHEIQGIHLVYEENAVDRSASLWSNLRQVPASLPHNLSIRREILSSFRAEVVISDFESWAYFFGRTEKLPVISIDNMQIINRCRHPRSVRGGVDWHLAKLAVKAKLPGAWHYLITSFFFPAPSRPRTTLIPPILRPEILAATPEVGEHVLVYQTAGTNTGLLPMLQRMPGRFRLYGMIPMGQPGRSEGNVELRPFSEAGFVEDLRTARAVVAGGGFSLMGEAVHLHKPMLSVPIRSQYEQVLNAAWLERLGYGKMVLNFSEDNIAEFLGDLDACRAAVSTYPRYDMSMLYACVDELLADAREVEYPKPFLLAPAVRRWEPGQPEDGEGAEPDVDLDAEPDAELDAWAQRGSGR